MANRTQERIDRYNNWLAAAAFSAKEAPSYNTLTRARAAWKALSLDRRIKVLKEVGFLCEDCNRQAQAGKTVCRKCEAARKEKQDQQAKGDKKVGKASGKTVKDHAGHRPKGKKGKA